MPRPSDGNGPSPVFLLAEGGDLEEESRDPPRPGSRPGVSPRLPRDGRGARAGEAESRVAVGSRRPGPLRTARFPRSAPRVPTASRPGRERAVVVPAPGAVRRRKRRAGRSSASDSARRAARASAASRAPPGAPGRSGPAPCAAGGFPRLRSPPGTVARLPGARRARLRTRRGHSAHRRVRLAVAPATCMRECPGPGPNASGSRRCRRVRRRNLRF